MQTIASLLLLAAVLFVTANCLTAEGGSKVSQDEINDLIGAYRELKDFDKIKPAILALAGKEGGPVPTDEKLAELKKVMDKAIDAPRVGHIQQLGFFEDLGKEALEVWGAMFGTFGLG